VIVAGREGGADGVRIVLETEEAMLLSELADQVDSVLLLGGDDDPALGRLFPSAYEDDEASANEFARYTRESLVDGKRQAAQSVRDATAVEHPDDGVVQIELDQAQAWGWLTFLTDLRLILAERVGLDDDEDDTDVETRDDYLRAAYEWAGFVQGSMLEVLDPIKP
jgi:hypothetical protein